MTKDVRHESDSDSKLPELRWWWVLAIAAGTALVTGVVMWLLVARVSTTTNAELAKAELDAIRTSLGIGIGAGGAFALWLATRRQRSTEIQITETARLAFDEKQHRERVHAMNETDLTERRITELYTKAVEQIGSEKAPVRLGGLYALERLADSNANHRQTIVNVICSYLRMPYQPPQVPRNSPANVEPNLNEAADERPRLEELQVRLTAQGILANHLRTSSSDTVPWGLLDVNLREAVLIDFSVVSCEFNKADFSYARFVGASRMHGTRFHGEAWFFETAFEELANFEYSHFHDRAIFTGARFNWDLRMRAGKFYDGAYFWRATFSRRAVFEDVEFHGDVQFENARMESDEPSAKGEKALDRGPSFRGSKVFDADGTTDWTPPDGWRLNWTSPEVGEIARDYPGNQKLK